MYGIEEPYEKMKAVTRDRKVCQELLQQLVDVLDVADECHHQMVDLECPNDWVFRNYMSPTWHLMDMAGLGSIVITKWI
jgi:hypothetical protein